MAEKKKIVRIVTPKGTAKYCYVNTPMTKFDPDGVYKTDLVIPSADCVGLCVELDTMADEAYKEACDNAKTPLIKRGITRQAPYAEEFDESGEVPTGNIVFKFKTKAKVTSKEGREYNFTPQIFDAQGKAVDIAKVMVYGGSTIKVNFTPTSYYVPGTKMAGVSLKLNAIQIIELVSGGSRQASDYGFDEEDGYTSSSAPAFEGSGGASGGTDEGADF
jgi:hypothetical protein